MGHVPRVLIIVSFECDQQFAENSFREQEFEKDERSAKALWVVYLKKFAMSNVVVIKACIIINYYKMVIRNQLNHHLRFSIELIFY